MKKLICALLIVLNINSAIADCDFSTGITKQVNGYLYSTECHVKVGEMKRDLELANTQLTSYKTAIDLKDLALTKTNERADLWMNTSFKLQDRMNAVEDLKSKNEMFYFVLGIAFTGFAIWGARQLR